jgi:hypothetical protein
MNDIIITNAGNELIAKLLEKTSTATFTKASLSSKDYSGSNLENLTELLDIQQTSLISKITRKNDTTVEALASFDNTDVKKGYYIRTLGIYAKDSDENEILFGVATDDNPSYMPELAGKMVSGISIRANIRVEQSNQITVVVDPAATPTIQQIEDIEITLKTKLSVDGDSKDNTATFTSEDTDDTSKITAWTDVAALSSGEKHASILKKISTMFKNLRYLYKMLGTTDISAIGDGSVTGALSSLNSKFEFKNFEKISFQKDSNKNTLIRFYPDKKSESYYALVMNESELSYQYWDGSSWTIFWRK